MFFTISPCPFNSFINELVIDIQGFLYIQVIETFQHNNSLSKTSNMDRQLFNQKIRQKISVIKINTCVFVVFKTKRELKCQDKLFFWKHHFFVFITENV